MQRRQMSEKSKKKAGKRGWNGSGCVFTPFLLTFASLSPSLALSLSRPSNNCCFQADNQMSQTRVLFFDFSGCFSSSALQLFSSSVLQLARQVQVFFGCIVIMFAIKLMKSFALLPINLCSAAIRVLLLRPSRTVSDKSLLPNCAVHAKK